MNDLGHGDYSYDFTDKEIKIQKIKGVGPESQQGVICLKLEYSDIDFHTHYFHCTSLFLHITCFSEKWLVYVTASHTKNEVCFSYQ